MSCPCLWMTEAGWGREVSSCHHRPGLPHTLSHQPGQVTVLSVGALEATWETEAECREAEVELRAGGKVAPALSLTGLFKWHTALLLPASAWDPGTS